ncbi:MAG: hypothetical protein HRT77_07635 [Halioglobus sp.]|nr:hypothetical protein [Halioglobus sp.]
MTQARPKADHAWVSPVEYAILLAQLVLLSAAAYLLNISRDQNLPLLLPLILVGFAIHAWLPLRYRTGFFLFLSVLATCLVLGFVNGPLLLAIGLILFGICHLPFSFRCRVGGLLMVGAVLAMIRVDFFEPFDRVPMASVVLPILGSMFMFRLMLYLYDIRHETDPAPLTQRLSYFFMLPNMCFPLFPVVDYRGFVREHFSSSALATYQKGLRWIMRGIIHLLLYRLVYHFWTPAFDEVIDLADAVQYMVSSYLIYLRISGLFHIATGILCLFGYNLPDTHRLYFLATSFTDFWRRINIYWKDFVMKIFFYPLAMRLRKHGMQTAVVVASLATLIVSWMLHSYQAFWLLGEFPLVVQDAVFWTFLGIAVAINSVIEMKQGRKRVSQHRNRTFPAAFTLSLKTATMFCIMCILWSFWTTPSMGEWLAIVAKATQAPVAHALVLLGCIACAVILGTVVQLRTNWDWTQSGEWEPPFTVAASMTIGLALMLILAALPQVGRQLDGHTHAAWATLIDPQRLNQRDRENQTRGYYEELLTIDDASPKDQSTRWITLLKRYLGMNMSLREIVRATDDLRRFELLPDLEANFKGESFRTNRWGMRDQEYEKEKKLGVCRLSLFGDSHTMGGGLTNEQTYEALLEEKLNDNLDFLSDRCQRFEVLNFGVANYSVLESALSARQKVPQFSPDVIIYVTPQPDMDWIVERLSLALSQGATIDEPFIQNVIESAGVQAGMDRIEIEKRLEPVAAELVEWSYRDIAETAKDANAHAAWMFLPRSDYTQREDQKRYSELLPLAQRAGLVPLSLIGVFNDYEPIALQLNAQDTHPNQTASQLIAQRFLEVLDEHRDILIPQE